MMNLGLFTTGFRSPYPGLQYRVAVLWHFALFGVGTGGACAQSIALITERPIYSEDTTSVLRGFRLLDSISVPGLPWELATGTPSSVALVGDLDTNGYLDLAVGYPDVLSGKVYILLMAGRDSVIHVIEIGEGQGGLEQVLDSAAGFGRQLAGLGDVDGDGIGDLAVFAPGQVRNSERMGAVFLLRLNAQGGVKDDGHLTAQDTIWNISAIASAGDLDGNGVQDLLVSDLTDSLSMGRVQAMLLDTPGTVLNTWEYDRHTAWPEDTLAHADARFGRSMAGIGDVDGNGIGDIAVAGYAVGGAGGVVHILLLDSSGTVLGTESHAGMERADPAPINDMSRIGFSLCALGDLNGDGTPDLAASIPQGGLDTLGQEFSGEVRLLYLKPDGTLQHQELIADSCSLSRERLGIGQTHLFGTAIASGGDLTGDMSTDLAIVVTCASDTAGCAPAIMLVHTNPKPLVATVEVVHESVEQLGSASVDVKGGVRPYVFSWAHGLPKQVTFDSLKTEMAVFDWPSLGLRPVVVEHVSYDTLLQMATPNLDALPRGAYHGMVTDAAERTLRISIDIGGGLKGDRTSGMVIEGRQLTKTSADGWTNNEYTSLNMLGHEEDGWMKFKAPPTGNTMAVGVREFSAEQANGFEQMDQAFVFRNDTIRLWYEGQEHSTGIPYTGNEICRLERQGASMRFMVEDSLVHSLSADSRRQVSLDVSIYGLGEEVRDLTTSFRMPPFPTAMKVKLHVEQMQCAATSDGLITVAVPNYPFSEPLEYTWTFPDGSTQQGPGLAVMNVTTPGWYHVTVFGTLPGLSLTGSASVLIGYEALWYEHHNTATGTGAPNTLKHNYNDITAGHAATMNEFELPLSTSEEWFVRTIGHGIVPCEWAFILPISVDRIDLQRLSDGGVQASIVNWDLGPTSVILVEQAGTPLGPACVALEGTRVMVRAEGTDLIVDNINDLVAPAVYPGVLELEEEYRLVGELYCPGTEITKVLTSFGCREPQRALLHDDLSGGYHRTANGRLLIGYWEDYNDADGQLDYRIHERNGSVVLDGSTASPPVSVRHGYNELEISLLVDDQELPEGFYWMEVTNEKGITKYLRFHYDNSEQ